MPPGLCLSFALCWNALRPLAHPVSLEDADSSFMFHVPSLCPAMTLRPSALTNTVGSSSPLTLLLSACLRSDLSCATLHLFVSNFISSKAGFNRTWLCPLPPPSPAPACQAVGTQETVLAQAPMTAPFCPLDQAELGALEGLPVPFWETKISSGVWH